MSCQDCLNRRDFLAKSAMAAAALVVVEGCGDGQIGPRAVGPSPGLTIRIADFPELATLDRVVAIGNNRALVRTSLSPPAFRALLMICTHEGCDTEVHNNRFECPCHGSIFDATGAVVRGPSVANNGITPLRMMTAVVDETAGTVTVS